MKTLLLLAAISLAGCSTIQDYCESSPEHSRVCVVTAEVVAGVAITCIALSITHSNQVHVVKNCNPADASCK